MGNIVDARGLSCPQPVLDFLHAARQQSRGEITILVDTDTARENVVRTAENQGWQVIGLKTDGPDCRITVSKD